MDAKNQRPEFEDINGWLDIALRERANAEPRRGLEERVLARLAAQSPQRFAWWPVWATVAAIFVIALTLAVMYPRRQERVVNGPQHTAVPPDPGAQAPKVTPHEQRSTTASTAANPRDAACCVSARMPVRATPQSTATQGAVRPEPERLPRLATFPAPRPETTQERLLAQLAAQLSVVQVASVSDDAVPLKHLSIPELKIDPMEGTPPDQVRKDEFGRKDASQNRK